MHSLGQPVSAPDIEEMIKEADTNCIIHSFIDWELFLNTNYIFFFLADGQVDFAGIKKSHLDLFSHKLRSIYVFFFRFCCNDV